MRGFRWIALQGSSRGLFLPPLLLFCYITTSGIPAHAADDPTACRAPVARIVSIQGTIEVLRAHQNDWSKVTRLDTPLCEGDRLRTGALSRAALFIQPETLVRVDQNTRITVSQSAEETLVEFTQEELLPAAAGAYSCGAGYFITRFPRKFRVNTPHLNAAVEGTEFLVAMRCESTELSVFEGKVVAAGAGANVFPSQTISSGQILTIGGTEPPAIKLHLKPADAVQWTLYYPPITPADAQPVEDCRVVPEDNRVSCLIARAEQMLRAGRVDEAQANIGDARAIAPESSDAKALSSIISLVRNDKVEALRLAKEAVDATTNSAPAWLALSYAQQADFKLEAALTSAQRASELTSSSALAFARVAELQLSLGWTREAEKTARQSVAANPSESRAHMILGFVHLAQINVKEAREDFEHAIELDSTDPLSRLGLGLATIRKGNLVEGREQIEIAVALDPSNSLIRSYVGKAYYEENNKERDELASTQFGLAKKLDPNDPTPWFYGAILSQAQNRPIDALTNLQNSIERNDLRAPYRSTLLLDQDRASRLVNLAEIYREIGFEQLALSEASRSLLADPHNYSANRFLAEAYEVIPRAERTGDSQYLQALLRSPIGIIPISPFRGPLAAFPSTLPRGSTNNIASPFRTAFSEYTPLYERPGTRVFLDALGGTQGTFADQAIVSGSWSNISMSFGQGHFRTDGFQEDREFFEDSWIAFGQVRALNDIYLQAELAGTKSKRGVVAFDFDPSGRLPLKVEEDISRARIGARYEYTPNTQVLLNISSQEYEEILTVSGLEDPLEGEASSTELQYSFAGVNFGFVAGSSYWKGTQTFIAASQIEEASFTNIYAYAHISDSTGLVTLQTGLTNTSEEAIGQRFGETSPKIGLVLSPYPGTTIRLSAFQATRRQTVANETLEPTQIAGFNQYWDDGIGSVSRQRGIGLDQRLGRLAYAGVEYLERYIEVPLFITTPIYFEWEEQVNRAFAYLAIPRNGNRRLLPSWTFSVSMDLFYEQLKRPETFAPEGVVDLETYIAPFVARAFPDSCISLKFGATYVKQSGRLYNGVDSFSADSDFWTIDLAANAKLPRRRGRISVGISNLFDRRSQFTETSPSMSRFSSERAFFARLTLALP